MEIQWVVRGKSVTHIPLPAQFRWINLMDDKVVTSHLHVFAPTIQIFVSGIRNIDNGTLHEWDVYFSKIEAHFNALSN